MRYFRLLQTFGYVRPAIVFVVMVKAKKRKVVERAVGRVLVKVSYLALYGLIDAIKPETETTTSSALQQNLFLHVCGYRLSV